MRLQNVPPRRGLQWALMGMRTFWRQPLAMSGLFFMYMAMVMVMALVPLVGPVADKLGIDRSKVTAAAHLATPTAPSP